MEGSRFLFSVDTTTYISNVGLSCSTGVLRVCLARALRSLCRARRNEVPPPRPVASGASIRHVYHAASLPFSGGLVPLLVHAARAAAAACEDQSAAVALQLATAAVGLGARHVAPVDRRRVGQFQLLLLDHVVARRLAHFASGPAPRRHARD